jgi:hypothetical protein
VSLIEAWRCDGCGAEQRRTELERDYDEDQPIGWIKVRERDIASLNPTRHFHSWTCLADYIARKESLGL